MLNNVDKYIILIQIKIRMTGYDHLKPCVNGNSGHIPTYPKNR